MQQTFAMRGLASVCVLVGVATTSLAHADDGPPGTTTTTAQAPKSEDAAFWWSTGSTIAAVGTIGVGLAVSAAFSPDATDPPRLLKVPLHNWGNGIMAAGALATLVTPSFGEWYAHDYVTLGLGMRLAGLALVGLGSARVCGVDVNEYPDDCSTLSPPLVVAGAALYVGGVVRDLAHARTVAREYDHAHARVAVVPLAAARTAGLAIAGTF